MANDENKVLVQEQMWRQQEQQEHQHQQHPHRHRSQREPRGASRTANDPASETNESTRTRAASAFAPVPYRAPPPQEDEVDEVNQTAERRYLPDELCGVLNETDDTGESHDERMARIMAESRLISNARKRGRPSRYEPPPLCKSGLQYSDPFDILGDPEVHARVNRQQHLLEEETPLRSQEPGSRPSCSGMTVAPATSSGIRQSPSLTSPSPISSTGCSEAIHSSTRSPASGILADSSPQNVNAQHADGDRYVAASSPQPRYVVVSSPQTGQHLQDHPSGNHTRFGGAQASPQSHNRFAAVHSQVAENRRGNPLSMWTSTPARPLEADVLSSSSPATSWSSTTGMGPTNRSRCRRSSALRESSEEESELEERERRLAEEEAKLAEYERLVLKSEKMVTEAKKAKIEQREMAIKKRREELQKRLAEAVNSLEESKTDGNTASEDEEGERRSGGDGEQLGDGSYRRGDYYYQ